MAPSDVPADLDQLLDRAQIDAVLRRYCRAADRCDAELMARCYHPRGVDEHGPFAGDAAAFVAWVIDRQRTTSITTQHRVTNAYIEVAGTTAQVEAAFVATHIRPTRPGGDQAQFVDTFWGRYVDRFDKIDGTWAISARQVVHDWSERRPVVELMPNASAYPAGRRDRSDVSYCG